MKKTLIYLSLSGIILGSACDTNNVPGTGNNNGSSDNNGSNISAASVETVSQEEFDKLKANPNFTLVDDAKIKANEEMENSKLIENEKIVSDFVKSNPDKSFLLNDPSASDTSIKILDDGNYQLKVNTQSGTQNIITMGKKFKYNTIATALKTFPTYDNQLEMYKNLYESLPENEKTASAPVSSSLILRGTGTVSSFPTPENIAKLSAEQIAEYNTKLSDRIKVIFIAKVINNTPAGYVSDPTKEEGYGTGNDRTGSGCSTHSSNGIYKNYNWENKYFSTSVKDQGGRGTCVAFSIASINEMTIAKTKAKWVNLSEQDYYYKNKAVWWPSTFGDGLSPYDSLNMSKLSLFLMPYENDWNYNPSYSRSINITNPLKLTYNNSCNGYNEECSDTNHQGKITCTDIPGTGTKICGSFSGANSISPYPITGSIMEAWNVGYPDISIITAQAFVSAGFPAILSFSVTSNFENVGSDGYVTYSANETNKGGHAVHVTGVITNDMLSKIVPSAPAGSGGGYFIVKNSWGTCFGDAGYVYLPFDFVRKYATSFVIRK